MNAGKSGKEQKSRAKPIKLTGEEDFESITKSLDGEMILAHAFYKL